MNAIEQVEEQVEEQAEEETRCEICGHKTQCFPCDYCGYDPNSIDIRKGDLVDFGNYGSLYVVNTNCLTQDVFWVTDEEEDRYNTEARGWFIEKDCAEQIIEEGNWDLITTV